jgi:diguanylate cyclase (GGDEF)-like protein/PAS domain S-box-containing protein
MQRTVHELRVHQIELEMQNEELRQTQKALNAARLHYADLYHQAPVGYCTVNDAGLVLEANLSATTLLGASRGGLVAQIFNRFIAEEDADTYYLLRKKMVKTGEAQSGELRMVRQDGAPLWVHVAVSAAANALGAPVLRIVLTDITERKTAKDQIENLAFYDPLTGLPNRRLLLDRLAQAMSASLRHQRLGALLFVDLDDFKTINDTLGHHQGDLLLAKVAKRLSACIRDGDTVARLGGDEFVVMLERLSDNTLSAATYAESVGEKILLTLNRTYQLSGCEHHSAASIGITLFGGGPQESIDEPLKRADLAMYQAKAAGRNTMRFFDPQMQAVVSARAALDTALRDAVQQEQFFLLYQAQVDRLGRLIGVEALVRWQHPQRGLVSPGEFIPQAEETGLILPLGQWVLEAACTQLAAWATQPSMAHLTVAVNVSARQFHQADFVARVLAALQHTGANPQRLKLELTESLLVAHIDDVIAKMCALKAHGVGFSLDDFGTGYSSLSYLKQLPLDQLKIDQSFVRDLLTDTNDAVIARTIVALGHSLGLKVIAEGVETAEQRDLLAGLACDAYQGYYFGRPVLALELLKFK